MKSGKVSLPGSHRDPIGKPAGEIDKNEIADVSIILKRKNPAPMPLAGGIALSREKFAEQHGADEQDLAKVRKFAQENGLKVVEESPSRRTVRLEATVAAFEKAFDATLEQYEQDGFRYRARQGELSIPQDMADSIEAVLGLDNRPQAKPHFRVLDTNIIANAAAVSYTPRQVAQLYGFPLDVDGTGQSVGIIELGGGYKPADLKNYFSSIGVKEPTVTSVSVDKGKNKPTTASSSDGEVLLDIEVVGAIAPGCRIAVYFAPNTTQGFQDALTTAIHDTSNKPSVISISWGGPESSWTAQSMTAMDSAAEDAAALGVSICVASGDSGSSDGVSDKKNHVDFPASSPHVLACGGTSLQSSGESISSETVWNDGTQGGATGGGYSAQFPLPSWQQSAGIKPPAGGGRGVPDVSGDADPETGYQVLVDGQSMVIGGTSAVAPLWVSLIALLNQKLGKPLGFLQPTLYGLKSGAKAFNDITQGSNGAFPATVGWDAATGLGSPRGASLLTALSGGTLSATDNPPSPVKKKTSHRGTS